MISNVILVHGCNDKDDENIKKYNLPPQNERGWIYWVGLRLKEKGIKTYAPLMPNSQKPSYQEWKKVFEKLPIDENTVLIGHSAGAGFLVRWLGETGTKIKKLILVAPAIVYGGYSGFLNDLLSFTIDKQVKDIARKIIIFVSDNESDGIKKAVEIYCGGLGIRPITLKARGHFTESGMGTKEFPELLEKILE